MREIGFFVCLFVTIEAVVHVNNKSATTDIKALQTENENLRQEYV